MALPDAALEILAQRVLLSARKHDEGESGVKPDQSLQRMRMRAKLKAQVG